MRQKRTSQYRKTSQPVRAAYDIIVKDRRGIIYGHKLNLTSGRSGLIFDVVVEKGNPADSQRFMPMLERHIDHFGIVPKQVAAYGGYTAKDNLSAAHKAKVKDVLVEFVDAGVDGAEFDVFGAEGGR